MKTRNQLVKEVIEAEKAWREASRKCLIFYNLEEAAKAAKAYEKAEKDLEKFDKEHSNED